MKNLSPKICIFENNYLSLQYQIKIIKTMAYNSKREDFFKYQKRRDGYITTIETKKYGFVDVLGCYNCRWCHWEVSLYSHTLNEYIKSMEIASINTPTDEQLIKAIDK